MNINLTIIGQSLTFLVFVIFCMKFVWPVLIQIMVEREKRIENGLQAADQADQDLEVAKKKVTEQLQEAKATAADIVEQSNRRASQIIEEAKSQAVLEADRIKLAAHAEVEREYSHAREELRKKVAALALFGAEKVLSSSVDQSAHSEMLEKLATEL